MNEMYPYILFLHEVSRPYFNYYIKINYRMIKIEDEKKGNLNEWGQDIWEPFG